MALKYASSQWDPGTSAVLSGGQAFIGLATVTIGTGNATLQALVTEQFQPVYEDNVNGVAKVEQRFSYGALQSTTTTNIKASAGFLHTIVVQTVSCPTTAIYDNTVPSGTKLGWFTCDMPRGTYTFDTSFATGLTLDPVAGGGGVVPFFTVSFR